MNLIPRLTGWTKPSMADTVHVRRYSTTGDILAYKRCRRQYGVFAVRKWSSATATQRYFGVLVHDVLDRTNREFKINELLPTHEQLELYINDAHDRLIRSGVRPFNRVAQKELATKLIKRFVDLIGPSFFKNVKQTEYRLERSLQTDSGSTYILEGIVDIVAGAVLHAMGMPFSTESDDVEIWDYKSGRRPPNGSNEMQAYQFQMYVYCELYRRQTGRLPARAVLVFLGNLGIDKEYEDYLRSPAKCLEFIYVVHPRADKIEEAIANFNATVDAIESERSLPYKQQWTAPKHEVDEQTCRECELRLNCVAYPSGGSSRGKGL